MEQINMYTQQQVEDIAQRAAQYAVYQILSPPNLDNCRAPDLDISQQGDDGMLRLRERVIINGQEQWITGSSRQDMYERYVMALERMGLIEWIDNDSDVPILRDYLREYYSTFKQKQEQNTQINRERIIRNHILPVLGDKRVDRISVTDCQKWFNDLNEKYAKETILKIRNTLSPVLDAAVEDKLIQRNPLKSDRIEIGGKDTVSHKAIPRDKFDEIKSSALLLDGKEQIMVGLLCYTGMRFEEILGMRWDDIDSEWIKIRRAVVHPTRNQPVVKGTKTKTSERMIPLCKELELLLENNKSTGYMLPTDKDPTKETPLSYSEARRLFNKIRNRFDIKEYSAHDFRDTCATVWRENGIPLDVIARLLGHAKTETTERKYVKYRPDLMSTAMAM